MHEDTVEYDPYDLEDERTDQRLQRLPDICYYPFRMPPSMISLYLFLTQPTKLSSRKIHYSIIDLYQTAEQPLVVSEELSAKFAQKSFFVRIAAYLFWEQSWILLLLLGILSGMTAILVEVAVAFFISYRIWVQDLAYTSCRENGFSGCKIVDILVHVLLCTAFCCISGAAVRFVSPQAAGSGLPEMKSILSGVVLKRYLSYRTYLAKLIGLVFALAGGLSVGKEGPFVHISGIIANQLSKISFFDRVRGNESVRFQMLSAGTAAGVACVFGAPIGGVLFSLEVTNTYFLVSNLWKSFFCAVSGVVLVKLAREHGLIAMFATNFDPTAASYRPIEIVFFICIGVLFGYLGALFVRLLKKLVFLRRDYKSLAESRYLQLAIIGVLTSVVIYPFAAVQGGVHEVINSLFGDENSIGAWKNQNILTNLFVFVTLKFFLTAISLGLPIPCGLYTPVFIMGAAGGRLIGEILAILLGDHIIPAGYAVVGAAAMSSSVTRTLSTAVIVFELTGQLDFLIPILLATVIATIVGNRFSAGAYETLLEQKRLPFLPTFGNIKIEGGIKTAGDMCKKNVVFLRINSTFNDIESILAKHNYHLYPVVSADSMMLQGSVARQALVKIVEDKDSQFEEQIKSELLQDFIQSFARDELGSELLHPDNVGMSMKKKLPQRRQQFFNSPATVELEKLSRTEFKCPFQVTESAHFYKIHFLFVVLGLGHALVTRDGKLVGVITKKDFLKKTKNHGIESSDLFALEDQMNYIS